MTYPRCLSPDSGMEQNEACKFENRVRKRCRQEVMVSANELASSLQDFYFMSLDPVHPPDLGLVFWCSATILVHGLWKCAYLTKYQKIPCL